MHCGNMRAAHMQLANADEDDDLKRKQQYEEEEEVGACLSAEL